MRIAPTEPGQQLRSISGRHCVPAAWSTLRSPAINLPRLAPAALNVPDGTSDPDSDLARLEAVLLLAREPLSSRKLSQFANLADGTQARTLIRRLNAGYDAAGRAFRVEQVAGGFQLLTRREFASWLRRLAHVPGETRLSAPTLETLAVIAYRQPVPRADIEAIRGVNCGELLRQLIERDLVRISGRSEELGRPFLYATTKRFLQMFGLVSTDDLPRAEALRQAPLPDPRLSLAPLAAATNEATFPSLADEPPADENYFDDTIEMTDEFLNHDDD
jgi:segregation and condensation protein B